ncbi:phosphate ABC transporter substrate-binding protein [Xanthomonas indica]|uniref:Phosphate ABC transporter substrate-binding protein n=1 Tax=Xanthomonas indica TaxID=2912242 RepID=A0AAU8I7K5_9XANT|nr:phosphate ABC transporter substrate-binding protein [Xanthomonas indica]MCI2245682.1 phosphate ABC transporter substrate-binding protein [Xanthomonas indica]MCI2260645.1 phosphate ABC transporter substrate-binding protein [Xanthomonas indica]
MNAYKIAGAAALALLFSTAAQAEVVVVMSSKSPVDSLSKDQVAQIFLAKSNSLPGGAQATPIDQDEGAKAREEFYKKVTGRDAAQLKSYWSQLMFTGKAQRPKHVAGDDAVKKAVAASPGAIGYIDAGAQDASVKVVFKP